MSDIKQLPDISLPDISLPDCLPAGSSQVDGVHPSMWSWLYSYWADGPYMEQADVLA